MFWRSGIMLMVSLNSVILAQNGTRIDLAEQGRNADFSSFAFTRPISMGSAMPASCQTGQLFFNTAAAAGANLYGCLSQNTWALLGGYTLPPAGANSLGGVRVPNASGLTVGSNGVLSVSFGTGTGTAAAGNDSRIVNALQPTSLIPAANITGLAPSATTDTTNASNITSGILSTALLPVSVVQNRQVNTYLNQSAPATPGAGSSSCWTDTANKNWECKNDTGTVSNTIIASAGPANQFASGISATGIISYAQPSFNNLSGTIATSQLAGMMGGDLSGSLPNPAVAKVNGTSIPPNSSADQAVVTTGAAKGSWASLPNCVDAAGQHLNYDTSSHSFSCGSTGGTVGSTAFSGLSGGTNTNAAMLVGTGASLGPAASGTITASKLAATPTTCSSTQAATGIDVYGNALGCWSPGAPTTTFDALLPMGSCPAMATPALGWDAPTSGNEATGAGCSGANVNQAYASFANSGTPALLKTLKLPPTFVTTNGADVYVDYLTSTASGTFNLALDLVCTATNGTATNDPTWTANNFFAPGLQAGPSTANEVQSISVTGITWPAGCAAGSLAHFRLIRTDTTGTAASVLVSGVTVVGRRTL